MNNINNKNITPMEDDEDLEFLRLAALKSLNSKKQLQLPPAVPNSNNVGNAIQVLDSVSGPHKTHTYFPPDAAVPGQNIRCINRFDEPKLDINEPYVPQRLGGDGQWVECAVNEYVPYVPTKINAIVPNVQLSPRSAAFVSQNNDILMRRKGGLSPDSPRSLISPPYRSSPGRWSMTPPPKHIITRSPNWDSRRSTSRSPISHRVRSPIFRRSPPRHGAISRSPPPMQRRFNSRSPPLKRMNSRSPVRYRHNSPAFRRSISRSPTRNIAPLVRPHSRSPLPYTRRQISPSRHTQNNYKNWRSFSPVSPNTNRINSNNLRKSPSPRLGTSGSLSQYRTTRRRTRSPPKLDLINHTDSRSPNRKQARSSKDRPPTHSNKRRSPLHLRKYGRNNTNTTTSGSSSSNSKNNNRSRHNVNTNSKRTFSPVKKKSRSKTPLKNPIPSEDKIVKDKKQEPEIDESKKIEEQIGEIKLIESKEEEPRPKTEQEIEDELLASTDNESSSDENDDGIDLFASEESESENEGRFKSSSSKNERSTTASTVSFSKLGTASASTVRDLNDVKSDKPSARKDRDDRYSSGNRNNNYSSRRDDRFRKNNNNRSNTSRSSYKQKTSASSSSLSKNSDDKKKDEKSMFKSTFQIVESEPKGKIVVANKTADNPKPIVKSAEITPKEKPTERKNVVQLKRTTNLTEDNKDGAKTTLPTQISSVATTKKPIHLRLGAMTKTWKNKKHWRIEKV